MLLGDLEDDAPTWPSRTCQSALLGTPAVARGGRDRSASLQKTLPGRRRTWRAKLRRGRVRRCWLDGPSTEALRTRPRRVPR